MTLNVGHRGFGVYSLENTLSAFKKAIDYQLDMVELDVRLTKDHQVIVFHDSSLKRLASIGLKLDDIEYSQLKKIHIFRKRDKKNPSEYEKIPRLSEVLELAQNKIDVNIELKLHKKDNEILVHKVIDLVKDFAMPDKVIISSFSKEILEVVSSMDEHIRCGYIFHKNPRQRKKIFNHNFSLYSIHPHKYLISKALVGCAKEKSVKVIPWTVNSAKLMRKLIHFNVDGIITNYPLKLANVLLEKELKEQ